MSPADRPTSRYVHADIPRGRYVAVEIPGTDPGVAIARCRRELERLLADSPVGVAARLTHRRVVFGPDGLREKLSVWDHGLDDYVVEALKGDMLGAAGPELDMAKIQFAERIGDMLWFSCRIPTAADLGRFAMPMRSYRHRAADPRCIEVDHPHLSRDWLVDIRVRPSVRRPSRRRPLPRTAG
jgi:hypothetical protein